MLSESTRNWIMQLVIDALRTGKMPEEELTEEEKKAFRTNYNYLKKIKEEMGDKAFSEITIDVGYDY